MLITFLLIQINSKNLAIFNKVSSYFKWKNFPHVWKIFVTGTVVGFFSEYVLLLIPEMLISYGFIQ